MKGHLLLSAQLRSNFGLDASAEKHGFLLTAPDGSRDSGGRPHWNGTDACCAAQPSTLDDVRYLTLLLDDIQARFNVDASRVYFIGYSNGGFMVHRMACERSTRYLRPRNGCSMRLTQLRASSECSNPKPSHNRA
ncbi:MAG: polyhydroxybutyrate depolymerase [Planctomycetota bacterium]|jgi:polyhydroxybutyrate depolymerase